MGGRGVGRMEWSGGGKWDNCNSIINKYIKKKNKKKTMAQVKEHIKARDKIQLRDKGIAKLSDAEFKTLVIRMPTELVEYGCKMEEKVKAMKSEIKENIQGTQSDGRKLELKSMLWTRRKRETSNQKRMKKQEFRKTRRGLRTSRTS